MTVVDTAPHLRVLEGSGGIDVAAAERAIADLLVAFEPRSRRRAHCAKRRAGSRPRTPRCSPRARSTSRRSRTTRATTSSSSRATSHSTPCANITSSRSRAPRTSATSPVSASSGCRSWRVWSSCSRADLQVQERLTKQVADWLQHQLAPKGVGVVLEAEHLCMSLRGVQASGSRTVTSAVHGLLRDDPRSRAEFFTLTGVHR